LDVLGTVVLRRRGSVESIGVVDGNRRSFAVTKFIGDAWLPPTGDPIWLAHENDSGFSIVSSHGHAGDQGGEPRHTRHPYHFPRIDADDRISRVDHRARALKANVAALGRSWQKHSGLAR
jgi:hypothetical protein